MKEVKFINCDTTANLMHAVESGWLNDGTFVFCNDTDRFYVKMHGDLIGITPKRRAPVKLQCTSCGAPLEVDGRASIVKCNHCGSVFDIDSWDTSL